MKKPPLLRWTDAVMLLLVVLVILCPQLGFVDTQVIP